MNKQLLDIYSDYLISSFSYTTATGLSEALSGAISHDKITRFLSAADYDSKQLWKLIKPTVRTHETDMGIFIVDDTIEEKQYTDESELITYHFDHTFGRHVKGVNILSLLYHTEKVNIPIAFQAIQKTEKYIDKKTGKERRKSVKTKNEYFREMAKTAIIDNQIKCKWVLADVWFSSNDNMEFIYFDLQKDFVMPIKTNRLVCLTKEAKRKGTFQQVEALDIAESTAQQIYIKELPFPVQLVKQVFKNEDGSRGILYLICSDTTVEAETIMDVYQKRWPIEEYHKSIVKHRTGEVTNKNDKNATEPFFCINLCVLQTRTSEDTYKTESLCNEIEIIRRSTSCQYATITKISTRYLFCVR